ncbi:hypothetical protein CBER1_10077 [Cercospora berteroae]|uniref:Uncharacterized protein n=1 Tax=Cercospora berteroae TaxID=357750 RepID=A0A2S6C6K1_9PEZI|nr:hypothetical protein CBER1_10077 [Cercospora berteroae]
MPPLPDSLWIDVLALFNQPWLRRAWAAQEVGIAPTIVMVCGKHRVDWNHHFRATEKELRHLRPVSRDVGTVESTTDAFVDLDGEATGTAADLGAEIGGTEEQTLEDVGSTVGKAGGGFLGAGGGSSKIPSLPKWNGPARRQLDKIAKGVQTLAASKGVGGATEGVTGVAVDLDGSLTGAAADLGQEVGSAEEEGLEGIGSGV